MTTHHQHTSDERHRHRPVTVRKSAPPTTWVLRSGEETLASPALSRFVGREAEVVELQDMVTSHRLVTVTGPPGVGKTRLARQVLAYLSEPGKAYVADLESTDEPGAVAATVAGLLAGVESAQDPVDALATLLSNEPHLVILDNCEHLAAACADLVDELLRRCAELRVIVTSREPLGLVGEAVLAVPPLTLPDPADDALPDAYVRSEAVQLFCDRAAGVQRGFVPTPEMAAGIVEICRRLDGLPLAIELAAARLAVLSLPEIVAGLDDRFTLLASPTRGAAARHGSLRAALDWSYDRLSVSERVLLGRLSVFSGGCTLDAAEDICAGGEIHADDVLDLLNALVAKSLVVADTVHRPARYRMLESVSHYAYQRLAQTGETARLLARHGRWCVEFLDRVASQSRRHERQWVEGLESEEQNLSAALQWAVTEGRLRTVTALVGRVVPYWWAQGRFAEAQRWLERALRLKGRAPAPLRVKLLCDAGHGAVVLGTLDAARRYAEEALALAIDFDDVRGRIEASKLLGFILTLGGERDGGMKLIEEALSLTRDGGEAGARAHALAARGRAHLLSGRARQGRQDFEESLAAAWGTNPPAVVNARVGIGWAAIQQGDYGEAAEHLEQALVTGEEMDDAHTMALALAWLAEIDHLRGDQESARARLERSLALARDLAIPHPLARALLGLGSVAQAGGDVAEAGQLVAEALSIARESSVPQLVAPCLVALGELARAEGDLAEAQERLDEALAAGRAWADPAAEAKVLFALGRLARAEGDVIRAGNLHHDALALRVEAEDIAGIAASAEAAAGLAAARGNPDAAARVFAGAHSIREERGCARAVIDQSTYEADVDLVRHALGEEAFDAAWTQGMSFTVDELVAHASRGRRRHAKASVGWDALTASERQVIDLVAEGLTNPQIAQRLCVSARTVQSHLRHVFTKLGVNSRTALAAEVMRRDG